MTDNGHLSKYNAKDIGTEIRSSIDNIHKSRVSYRRSMQDHTAEVVDRIGYPVSLDNTEQ